MKKKKPAPSQVVQPAASPVQTESFALSGADRANRDTALGQAGNESGAASQAAQTNAGMSRYAIDSTVPQLENFYKRDADGSTGFRRALTGMKSKATANAYDNALARTRERAQAAGFGSIAQPVTFGAENAIRNEQAGAIARIPGEVEMEAIQPEMQAIGMRTEQASLMDQIGRGETAALDAGAGRRLQIAGGYDPMGYFSTGAGMESNRLDEYYSQLAEERQRREEAARRKSGIFRGLAKVGLTAAGSLIPGAGGLTKVGGAI